MHKGMSVVEVNPLSAHTSGEFDCTIFLEPNSHMPKYRITYETLVILNVF